MLLPAMAAAIDRLVAAEGVLLGTELGQGRMQGGLVVFDADQQGVAGLGGLCEPLLLTMQRIGGAKDGGSGQLGGQARRRPGFVPRPREFPGGPEGGGTAGD